MRWLIYARRRVQAGAERDRRVCDGSWFGKKEMANGIWWSVDFHELSVAICGCANGRGRGGACGGTDVVGADGSGAEHGTRRYQAWDLDGWDPAWPGRDRLFSQQRRARQIP